MCGWLDRVFSTRGPLDRSEQEVTADLEDGETTNVNYPWSYLYIAFHF